MSNKILAFSGLSNLLSFCFGIYLTIFLGLPITEKLYRWLEPKIGRKSSATIEPESYQEETDMKNHDLEEEINKLNKRSSFIWFIYSLFGT